MAHSFATAAIPFDIAFADAVEARLRGMGAPPIDKWRAAVDGTGVVHFMSINVARDTLPGKAHILIEVSADGGAEEALRAVAAALEVPLGEAFAAADLRLGRTGVAGLMLRHYRPIGQGWFAGALGLPFDGSPGMSVGRLRAERDLAGRIGSMTDILSGPLPARRKLDEVRRRLWDEGEWKWAFAPEPAPVLDPPLVPPPADATGIAPTADPAAILPLLPSAIATLLWPVVPVAMLLWLGFGLLFRPVGWPGAILLGLVLAAIVTMLVLAAAGAWSVLHLRQLESTDPAVDRPPDPAKVGEMMKCEGIYAQGLLPSVSTIKPGRFRRDFVLRFAFWFILANVRRSSRPGFLGPIGVIHFARWFRLPGTDKLFFWSNYDGAWESYVEDFIQLGHEGVTAIWSNTRNFPKTRYLFLDGASDGDRLRRWARNQMYPPPLFWYSAYPDLTLPRIRTNAAIRLGLAAARTDDDAANWLSCFGSAPRPPSLLDRAEVPTLVFGGRRHLRFAACLVITMAGNPDCCRAWLRRLEPHITYGDARLSWALAFALSTSGFDKLGLPPEDLNTFPPVFRNGMTAPWRTVALGDVDGNAPERWCWGWGRAQADAVLLVYAKEPRELGARLDELRIGVREEGQAVAYEIEMDELPAGGALMREPFGFADGISQPVLMGTPRARGGRHPLHAVESGEFVLGYLDNSGHYPATATVRAALDPEHLLAETPQPLPTDPETYVGGGSDGRRDLGRNGTYLVVRQLEQNVAGFKDWLRCAAEAQRDTPLGRHVPDDAARQELIAAKLMGRWRTGASLVRHPHAPPSGANREPDNEFLYGREDPQGLGCPFGAHTRRANPRDSLDPSSPQAVDITKRHRILRIGRPYSEEKGRKRGTLFMCLNADIERQFEFLQQSWVLGRSFLALAGEADPLNGRARDGRKVFTVPTREGPVTLRDLSDFVQVRGGGYFFMPARRTLRFLAAR
jgi:Dyp-type peroxidase family